MADIGAAEAAARLGVKRETLYAYVSRGLLRRRPAPGGRVSVFDSAEVERLARRTRRGGRAGALELVIASGITSLEGDRLRYRGRDVAGLVGASTFEAVAEFLWSGDPSVLSTRPRWPAIEPAARLGDAADPINRYRVALAATAAADELRYDLEPRAIAAAGRRAIAAMAASLPRAGGTPNGRPSGTPKGTRDGVPSGTREGVPKGGTPKAGLRHAGTPRIAARLWPGLTALPATAARVAVLDAALVLLADHELAISTLAARLAASARADPYSVIATGLGVVAGGLHGGAGREVYALFDEVGSPTRAARVLGERLRRGARLPGLGHAVYRERDPRAATLLPLVAGVPLLPGRWPVVEAILAIVEERDDALVNVDFALGALAWCGGMGADATEAVFALARTAGWLAHAGEEYTERPVRFRPRAAYTGPLVTSGQDGAPTPVRS